MVTSGLNKEPHREKLCILPTYSNLKSQKQLRNKQTKQQQQKLHKLFTYELKTLVSSSWFLSNWPFPTCLTSQWSQHCSKGQSLPFEATRNSVESSNSGKHPPHPFAGHQSYKHQMLLWHWLWLWTLHVPYIWLLESFLHKNRWWLSPHILPCGPPRLQECILHVVASQFYSFLLPSVVTLSHFSWPSRERLLASSHEDESLGRALWWLRSRNLVGIMNSWFFLL